jgi:glycosyltransferase involved in cell wall biosynthesis
MVHYRRAGIGQYAISLLHAMAELPALGESTTVSVLQMRGDTKPIVYDRRFRRVAVRTPPHNRFEQPALSFELFKLRPRPSLIHSPDFVPPRFRTFPAVVNIQDLAFLKFPDLTLLTEESKRYYGQVGWAARNAHALIALSASARDDIVQLLGVNPRKITVIPAAADSRFRSPADPAKAREVADRRFGLTPDDGGYILFVGTIEPRKNLTTLVEAYSLLKSQNRVRPFPILAIVGKDGWLSEQLHTRIEELGLEKHIYFLRGVEDKDLPLFYAGARAFVLPSIYEGFGLPALEAMASGTPVISSSAGSLREVVGDAGILIDPTDVDRWVEAIERVLADDALSSQMSEAGLERAALFSWERAASETLALYKKVARR